MKNKITPTQKKSIKKARRLTLIDILIILAIVMGLGYYYRHTQEKARLIQQRVAAREALTKNKQQLGRVVFFDKQNRANIELIVELAQTDYEKEKGLMFRENLPETQGMLFVYKDEKPRTFWMKNTPLSLDMIFVDSRYHIVHIAKFTKPESEQLYPSGKPAQFIIEVRAGFCDHNGVKDGQRISWEVL